MSGEYFCIEEIVDSTNFHEEHEKTHRSNPGDTGNFCRDTSDNVSNASRKSQDCRLYEIEEQLQFAENRCNTLKEQLDSMKKNCQRPGRNESPSVSGKQGKATSSKGYKKNLSVSQVTLKNHCTQNPPHIYDVYHESTDTIPAKSSSSFSEVVQEIPVTQNLQVPLLRQNSNCIGTDLTGAAARTINNILSGITESVNRMSHLHSRRDPDQRSKNKHAENYSTNMNVVYGIPGKPFSPRVKQRIFEQQKKVEEIAREAKGDTNPDKDSSISIKSKSSTVDKWAKGVSRKSSKLKNKVQVSTANVNTAKHIRSMAKHVENTTKMKPVRTSMVNEGSHTVISMRKRKMPNIKRSRQSSKVTLSRKNSFNNASQKRLNQFATDKLIELYHNVAAKASDSDENNNLNKSSGRVRPKGAGDLSGMAFQMMSGYVGNKSELSTKGLSRAMNIARVLTPIEEQPLPENHDDCVPTITHNYALPTVSTKLKQVTKCYMQSFNFRSIPFCAAKSITPSHNIGINIQQVMSIIKTRQPITGVSPSLVHNISLAASKLQNSPLTAFVSNLSSRMTCGPSTCPLFKHPLNYNKLQEMAKEIKEEPFEEVTNYVMGEEGCSGGQNELPPAVPPIWTADDTVKKRCTCTSQKSVPFQQVLSKYQINSEATKLAVKITGGNVQEIASKPPITRQLNLKNAISGTRKQLTTPWVKNSTTDNSSCVFDPKHADPKTLQGRERTLKAVLKNLHDEFDTLNTKYEELSKEANNNGSQSSKIITEQLEKMETALNKKEDEINMVMSLFTEVLALKDQVKKLRQRTSSEELSTVSRSVEKREPKTALHLTQLLRQIRNYQNLYKNKL